MLNKEKLFRKFIKDICAKTKTKIPIIKPYKLRKYTAWRSENGISYHPEKISKLNYKYLLHIATHEVGHIRTYGGNRTTREYKAELFALKTIKKHYPKYFTLGFTKRIIKIHKKWYSVAFKRALKEFIKGN